MAGSAAIRRSAGVAAGLALLGGAWAFNSHAATPDPPSAEVSEPTTQRAARPAEATRRSAKSGPAEQEEHAGRSGTARIRVAAAVRHDGTFDVAETLRLRDEISRVTLAPPSPDDLGGVLQRAARPRVRSLQMTADGEVVAAAAEFDGPLQVDLPAPTTRIELRYRLLGATVLSTPSQTGRSLAVLAPLTRTTDPSLSTVLRLSGAQVLNVRCPALPATQRACAVMENGRVRPRVDLLAGSATVVVQLDLPSPS